MFNAIQYDISNNKWYVLSLKSRIDYRSGELICIDVYIYAWSPVSTYKIKNQSFFIGSCLLAFCKVWAFTAKRHQPSFSCDIYCCISDHLNEEGFQADVWIQARRDQTYTWRFHDGALFPHFCPMSATNDSEETHLRYSSMSSDCYDINPQDPCPFVCELQMITFG